MLLKKQVGIWLNRLGAWAFLLSLLVVSVAFSKPESCHRTDFSPTAIHHGADIHEPDRSESNEDYVSRACKSKSRYFSVRGSSKASIFSRKATGSSGMVQSLPTIAEHTKATIFNPRVKPGYYLFLFRYCLF